MYAVGSWLADVGEYPEGGGSVGLAAIDEFER